MHDNNKLYHKYQMTCLNEKQQQALNYISQKAKQESQNALNDNGRLMIRAKNLKISKETLVLILNYIRDEVPLIIHIHVPETLKLLTTDTHYRNQFETKTSGGILDNSSRRKWENIIFNNAYANSDSFDRCKYGCIDMNYKKKKNYSAAKQYGDSYLVLKSHVRTRTTCCYGDSAGHIAFGQKLEIGTLDNFAHILAKFTDDELMDIVSIINDLPYVQNHERYFKELQFHGPIVIDNDIEMLVLNEHHRLSQEVTKLSDAFKSRGIKVIYSNIF